MRFPQYTKTAIMPKSADWWAKLHQRRIRGLQPFFLIASDAKPLVRLPREKVQTANFKLILLRELGLPITRVVHTIAQADPRAWRKLGIRSRPHLVIEATAYTANGTVAYFQEIYIPTNRRKLLFDSELKGLEQIWFCDLLSEGTVDNHHWHLTEAG
jgi:hypothetical protein